MNEDHARLHDGERRSAPPTLPLSPSLLCNFQFCRLIIIARDREEGAGGEISDGDHLNRFLYENVSTVYLDKVRQ